MRIDNAAIPGTVGILPSTVGTRDGLTLVLKHWPALLTPRPRGIVCIVHGLGEHIGRYEHVAQNLNQAGWAVVGFDLRGHGKSDGARGAINEADDLLHDLATVIDAIKLAYSTYRLALLGHSLGGLIVARFAAAHANPLEHAAWRRSMDLCVLSSPALKISLNRIQLCLLKSVGRLAPNLAVANGLNPAWISTDVSVVKAYVNDPLVHNRVTGRLTRFMLESAKTVRQRACDWTIPTLLLYSGADRCVHPEGSRQFSASVPASLSQSKEYAHMAHEIFNEPDRETVLNALQDWLARFSNFGIRQLGEIG